jgi:hypothetical protein
MSDNLLTKTELEKLIPEAHESVRFVKKRRKPQILVKCGSIFIRSLLIINSSNLHHMMNAKLY